MLKIIERTKMPDGTDIQLEYDDVIGWHIGAYPIAKATGKYNLVKRNETFRLTIANFGSENLCKAIYKDLECGTLDLTDLTQYYWNGNKDLYYMGLRDRED